MGEDEIIQQLQRMTNGANVHTINKAVFYVRAFSNPSGLMYDPDRLRGHIATCKKAIETGITTDLKKSMERWF